MNITSNPIVVRLLSALGVALLLVGVATAASRTRTDGMPAVAIDPSPTNGEVSNGGAPDVLAPQTTPPGAATDTATTFTDPEAAAAAGAETLLATGLAIQTGAWADLGAGGYAAAERPVYVGRVQLAPDRRRVEATVTIAWRAGEAADAAILRLLAGSRAIRDAGSIVEVAVRTNGHVATHEVDVAGARLLVDLDPVAAGEATAITIDLAYDIPDRTDVVDDGGPAAFGLLAYNPTATALGHWLPLLTLPGDDGPMVPWGDVGAFPTAVWSLIVEHDGTLVTGGVDGPCPTEVSTTRGCTWSRGTALRDDAAVALDGEIDLREATTDGVRLRAFAPAASSRGNQGALATTQAAVTLFSRDFGALAWPEFDVVAVPLSGGAAGMEFPGLVMIGASTYGAMDGGFGSYVVAHEAGHQWFHALLGNGSLSSPVVDESLAQYLSYLYYVEAFGQGAGDDLVRSAFEDRYASARQGGLQDEAPGKRLDEFAGGRTYNPLVYARAPLAWVDAEAALGREIVVGFLRELVAANALGFVDTRQVIDAATAYDAELGAILTRYWLDPEPVR